MAMFELTLRGFNGATDKTDHLILWVDADMTEEQVKAYFSREGLYRPGGLVNEVIAIPDVTSADQADFALPRQLYDLKARAAKLVQDNERPMEAIIEKLLVAADNHGEDSGEPDHTVGDLQGLLRRAWGIMSVSQRRQLLKTSEVAALTEAGGRGEFDRDDLVTKLNQKLVEMEAEVRAAGYEFMEHEGGFYWETSSEASEDFHAREDAVASAYSDYVAKTSAS